jgi:hypothetical protein
MSAEQVCAWLKNMYDESIYDGNRVAQPDEVVNYKTGDGLEKAFVLANVIRQSLPEQAVELSVDGAEVLVGINKEYHFESAKTLRKKLRILPNGGIEASEV